MKKILFFFTCLFMFIQFSFAQEWQTDLSKSKEIANKKDLPIILVFQGSDWCIPCMKLDKNIWSTEKFKEYSTSHYVMLKADFPKKKKNALPEQQKKANDLLAEKYNPSGIFPLVVLLNKEGKVLGKTGFKNISPDEYIKELNSYLPKK